MRAVRIEVVHEADQIPLVLRARFERTFLGLGLFFASALLTGGAYLLLEAIREPLKASEASVILAGLALSLGGYAIVFLAWPRRHLAIARRNSERISDEWKHYVLTEYGDSVQNRLEMQKSPKDHIDLPGPM